MVAEVIATPVLEWLAAAREAWGAVRGASSSAAYLELDGFVIALTAPGVPLMPNGIAVQRTAVAGETVRAHGGRIDVGAEAIAWDAERPPAWEPALRRSGPAERSALGRRGAAILHALGIAASPSVGDDMLVSASAALEQGARGLQRALIDRDPDQAARAATRLIGLGAGLTPEGDDILAATAATVAALGEAVGFPAAEREPWLAALLPGEPRERTTALSVTLLELAIRGRIAEPVHELIDPRTERWGGALNRLQSIGASTGRAYAVSVGATMRLLAGPGTSV